METIQHPVVHDRSIPFIPDETQVLLFGIDDYSNPIVDYNDAAKEAYKKARVLKSSGYKKLLSLNLTS